MSAPTPQPLPDGRKVLVVTGASSGIGREVAREAAREGYAVIAVARRKARLDELAAEIANEGGTFVPIVLDVTAKDAPERIVGTAATRFGRIDVLINNAGSATAGFLLEQSDALIDAQWQLHVAAPLRITRAALPLLRESHGQVFFIGSGLARVPAPGYGAYPAAKAAIRAAAGQLFRELRQEGVVATYVDPGAVNTEFQQVAGVEAVASDSVRANPQQVAQRILRATRTRPRTLNAVLLHTIGAMIGELLPMVADAVLAKPPIAEKAEPAPVSTPAPAPQPPPGPQPEPAHMSESDFERALEPVARRMERVKLSPTFLVELLKAGSDVHLTDAAMRWAGMPNKNERAAMAEVLEALAAGGFLQQTGAETWHVLRSAH